MCFFRELYRVSLNPVASERASRGRGGRATISCPPRPTFSSVA
ncbi:hypothetical protein AVDCRST_MAG84-7547 [uncultured Microcoleus sp.]|uniref:Uncharacterized protein n=1 Tax=uncultured Microcoleus sp. TaxID=259945 RepID=A0A6J4PY33_9CYAN|nr:hypothetical protein AVDCRST_MAG84-7547 [uncultured Microcoleus sp.]